MPSPSAGTTPPAFGGVVVTGVDDGFEDVEVDEFAFDELPLLFDGCFTGTDSALLAAVAAPPSFSTIASQFSEVPSTALVTT